LLYGDSAEFQTIAYTLGIGHPTGRTGLDFHETYPQEGVSRLAESTLATNEANIDLRPIYLTEPPSELATVYQIQQEGSGLDRIVIK